MYETIHNENSKGPVSISEKCIFGWISTYNNVKKKFKVFRVCKKEKVEEHSSGSIGSI